MHKKFDNGTIEKKWQKTWREAGIYHVGARDAAKEKRYLLVELPYPSGDLHIGHWHAFGVPDILVRYERMQGKQVLFPLGFDAFGMPAENAAIKRGLDPKEWTYKNMDTMRAQLDMMGNAFSADMTCNTTDPEYFKWTQWMFGEFFKRGIAYRGVGVVNWCPKDNTVLANEQVLSDGSCERCGAIIEKREMAEWKLRITQYADRLIDDLDTVAWPLYIKDLQRNWIGRSKGATIPFVLSSGERIDVFTTRPDTLCGATYLALAPEHELLASLPCTNKDVVKVYVQEAKQKDDKDRMNATKEKTGVRLEGVTATNSATGEEIPVFVADYVLGGYGSGAVMGVPAHDERDEAFAAVFAVPSVTVINEEGTLLNSGVFDGLTTDDAKEKIVAKVGGSFTNTYRLRDWSIGRQRYWGVPVPIVYSPEGEAHPVPLEHLPWTLPIDVDFRPTGEAPLAKSQELRDRVESIFGKGWTPEVETMDTFVDSSWYFLRYFDAHNGEAPSSLQAQKDWMPVDLYMGGSEHTTLHLLYSRFWQKVLFDMGLVLHSEPYTKRINRGLILGPDGQKMSKSKGNVINPDEHVARLGADTVKMYLAFMGNYGEATNYPFDLGGIAGVRRFLERVNGLREHVVETESKDMTRLVHKTIAKVSEDVPELKFNTAISALMIFVNAAEKEGLSQESYETFLRTLAPFAPHLTEELWHELGKEGFIHAQPFPKHDPLLAKDDVITIGVQVAGKRRGDITIAPDALEADVLTAARANPEIEKYLSGEPKKVVYVPGRILNIIP